jgi:hypothetical protein
MFADLEVIVPVESVFLEEAILIAVVEIALLERLGLLAREVRTALLHLLRVLSY